MNCVELGDFYYYPGRNGRKYVRQDMGIKDRKRIRGQSGVMWLCQSSDNLASSQMVTATERDPKPYCSMNNLIMSNSRQNTNGTVHCRTNVNGYLERGVSLDAVYEEEMSAVGVVDSGQNHRPDYSHRCYMDNNKKIENHVHMRAKQQPSPGKGHWKRQSSALVKGICDLASGERLKMWKAKLPLVNRNRASRLIALAVECHDIRDLPNDSRDSDHRTKRFGQQSPTAMANEGNYDVPVTPNRFDSNATSIQAGGVPTASYGIGHRMVNANPYYQQQQQLNDNSRLMVNGQRSRLSQSHQGHQSTTGDVADNCRARYFAQDYSSYDNSENVMLSSRKQTKNSWRSNVKLNNGHQPPPPPPPPPPQPSGYCGVHTRSDRNNPLPSPVKIIACGGVPVNNADQPRLVKPSAFRPVQPASWQTAKAARIQIGNDASSFQSKPVKALSSSSSWSAMVNGHCVEQSVIADAEAAAAADTRKDKSGAEKSAISETDQEVAYDVAVPNRSRLENGHYSSPLKNGSDQNLVSSDAGGGGGGSGGSNHQQCRQIASRSSRNSSGIQVTPSPSDSGVAEYEAALREKDTEILKLRNMMEHNEQVIIRVYQEKEERWQEKLREWSNRLQAAMHNERKLLSQMQCMQQERKEIQDQISNLFAEKQGLLKMIRQLEKEVFDLRNQLSVKVKQWSVCQKCSEVYVPPQPAHRVQGERCAQVSTDVLRNELDALRLEVCEIRHSLQSQPS